MTMDNSKLLVLISSAAYKPKQTADQSRAMTLLQCKGISFDVVDGNDPAMKERRNQLFTISGVRGQYPQFFLADENLRNPTFVGDWDTVECINDNSALSDDILQAHPSILTWDKVLSGVAVSQ